AADEVVEAVDEEGVEVADVSNAVVDAREEGRPLSGEIKTLPTIIETPERPGAAVGSHENDAEVVVKRRGLGVNARLITTAAIDAVTTAEIVLLFTPPAVAAVIMGAMFLFVPRGNAPPPQTVASSADTSALAGGDVAIRG